jgi:signal transduction histidine kinase
MLDRLDEAFARERRFVDDASHELRTPVGVLRGRLELALSRSRTAEELEEALRRSLADAEHLSRLAEDLLSCHDRATGASRSIARRSTSPSSSRRRSPGIGPRPRPTAWSSRAGAPA